MFKKFLQELRADFNELVPQEVRNEAFAIKETFLSAGQELRNVKLSFQEEKRDIKDGFKKNFKKAVDKVAGNDYN